MRKGRATGYVYNQSDFLSRNLFFALGKVRRESDFAPLSGSFFGAFVTQLATYFSSPRAKAAMRAVLLTCAPFVFLLALSWLGSAAFAQGGGASASATPKDPPYAQNTGDTAWVLASAALVLFMTPGLAFFYGGLVRGKNVLNTIMMSYGAMALMAILWVVAGYSIAFGDNQNPYWGGLGWAGLPDAVSLFTKNYPAVKDAAGAIVMDPGTKAPLHLFGTVPHGAFMIFQMMFFIITPALISGSLVERMKFGAYLTFIGLWGLLVYCPVAHWVWHPAGWIFTKGAMDFAGRRRRSRQRGLRGFGGRTRCGRAARLQQAPDASAFPAVVFAGCRHFVVRLVWI